MLFNIISWYLCFFIFGLIGIIPTSYLFMNLKYKGIFFTKLIGILIYSLLIFLLVYLNIISFNRINLILILILIFFCNGFIFVLSTRYKKIITSDLSIYIKSELFFIVIFAFFLLFKLHTSPILGTEKIMDLMIINSIFANEVLPPINPWFSGESINYYYLGHMIVAIIAKITNINPSIAFNLAISSFFSLTIISMYGIINEILNINNRNINNKIFGLCGILFLFAGNIFSIISVYNQYNLDNSYEPFWWWSASRSASHILEFPSFSYILGDFHAHLIASSFLILVLALSLNFILYFKKTYVPYKESLLYIAVIPVATFYMGGINIWSTMYILGYHIAFFIFILISSNKNYTRSKVLLLGVHCILVSLSILLSSYVFLENNSLAIKLISTNFITSKATVYYWVPLIIPLIFYSIYLMYQFLTLSKKNILISAVCILLFIIYFLGVVISVALLFIIISSFQGVKLIHKNDYHQLFVHICLFIFSIMIILTHYIFIQDSFNNQMNTIFKFWYDGWIVLSIISPVYIYLILTNFFSVKLKYFIFFMVILFLFFNVYNVLSIYSRISDTQNKSLDGFSYLKTSNLDLYNAISWASKNLNNDIVLESVGNSYSNSNIFSAFTGNPTLLAWPGHQLQWGIQANVITKRMDYVHSIYMNGLSEFNDQIINEYNIKYIFIGPLERERFGINVINNFNKCKIVFSNNTISIVRICK